MSTSPHYIVKTIADFSELEKYQQNWDDLNNKTGPTRVFTRFNNLKLSWARRQGSWRNKLHIVLIFNRADELLLAVPLMRHYDFFGTYTLNWLDSGTPLYNNALLDPAGDLESLSNKFAEHLSSLRLCRKLKIDFIQENSSLDQILKAMGFRSEDKTFSSSIAVAEFDEWQQYLAGKSSNFRQNFNNFRNRIERSGGYRVENLLSRPEISAEIALIFSNRRDWVAKRPDLDKWIVPQASEDWFQGAAAFESAQQNAGILRLSCGQDWLASLLYFTCDKTIFVSKFAQSATMASASPGFMINIEVVRFAIENAFEEVDLMIGQDNWKNRLSTSKTKIITCRQKFRLLF